MPETILFIYVGDQQGSWGSISFHRPQHYYVMPGILYCAQVLRNSELSSQYDIQTRYINRSIESIDTVADQLCSRKYACIGFSCFTWNRNDMLHLASRYKKIFPDVPVMLGGPDINFSSETEILEFFQNHDFIDALAFGESEQKIVPFVKTLLDRSADEKLQKCNGYAFHPSLNITPDFGHEHCETLDHIPSIYPAAIDVPRDPSCGLAIVYETTRGCPYKCIYCRFSMHSHRLRRFPDDRIKNELQWLLDNRVDCIHVADAVFDQHPDHARSILSTLIDNNRVTSFFFYCSFNKLDDELAQLFRKSQCQIGVGVQSTNPNVLRSIHRAISSQLFGKCKDLLDTCSINFYTDLMFGLPEDSFESFENSFNQVIELDPSFVMAFPLTLIPGTPLGDDPLKFKVKPVDNSQLATLDLQCDIHYSNLALGEQFTVEQLQRFDDLAITLFYYFQRFPNSLHYLRKRNATSAFSLFSFIGKETKQFLHTIGRKPSNTDPIEGFDEEIFRIFTKVLEFNHCSEKEFDAFKEIYKLDILRLLIMESKKRKECFDSTESFRSYRITSDKIDLNGQQRAMVNAHGKLVSLSFRYNDLRTFALLKGSIEPASDTVLLFAPFEHWNATILPVSGILHFCVNQIEPKRPVRLQSLFKMCRQQFLKEFQDPDLIQTEFLNAIRLLADREYLLVC